MVRKALRTLTASVAPRPESKAKQRLLCMGAKRSSDCWTVRLALPYLGASVVQSATAHTDRISSLNSSGAVAANGSLARSNVRLHLKALLGYFSCASKKSDPLPGGSRRALTQCEDFPRRALTQ